MQGQAWLTLGMGVLAPARDRRGEPVALTVAVGASFRTPVGSRTHAGVHGPGGYRFGEYARLGAPLRVVVIPTNLHFVPLFWSF